MYKQQLTDLIFLLFFPYTWSFTKTITPSINIRYVFTLYFIRCSLYLSLLHISNQFPLPPSPPTVPSPLIFIDVTLFFLSSSKSFK